MDQKPIISVKEARKLLGKEYRDRSDGEIKKIIEDTHELAKIALEVAKQKVMKDAANDGR